MSVRYQAIGWNRQKKTYDSVIACGVAGYLALFIGAGALRHPTATAETLVIRALGTLALILLHLILCIGPLCRLNRSFLPLLYNRRHLGVAMFLIALGHGAFSIVQFHSRGDVPPLVSVFISNTRFSSLADFPFELPGFAALIVLFLMAATSHDFWLHTLSPRVWKRLHMLVYVAYGLLVGHVSLGALQTGPNNALVAVLGAGMLIVVALHLAAGVRERRVDLAARRAGADGFVEVGEIRTIPEKRARVISAKGERIAIFRYDGKISAISNVCRHQNGPLGEGRIIDGCVTCPWHGYQYSPESGASPPPFNDKVATFRTKVIGDKVFVHPCPHQPGTRLEPAQTEPSYAGEIS
jgi:nitrite reductase/ring-hydroxylating ferredoxin subunit/DMSO/TMAO reductase YedYZ heme-binding membrane subunit